MSTISTHLRNFKEPTKDQLTELFFALPASVSGGADAHGLANGTVGGAGGGNGSSSSTDEKGKGAAAASGGGPSETELEKMEINAVLSLGVQGEEDSYVSACAFCAEAGRRGRRMQKHWNREWLCCMAIGAICCSCAG